MAMQLGKTGGVKSDINVTPLVDVMLVLLIIMMIVAPMLQKGVDVKLHAAGDLLRPEVLVGVFHQLPPCVWPGLIFRSVTRPMSSTCALRSESIAAITRP